MQSSGPVWPKTGIRTRSLKLSCPTLNLTRQSLSPAVQGPISELPCAHALGSDRARSVKSLQSEWLQSLGLLVTEVYMVYVVVLAWDSSFLSSTRFQEHLYLYLGRCKLQFDDQSVHPPRSTHRVIIKLFLNLQVRPTPHSRSCTPLSLAHRSTSTPSSPHPLDHLFAIVYTPIEFD
jgi:hypothetical protein